MIDRIPQMAIAAAVNVMIILAADSELQKRVGIFCVGISVGGILAAIFWR